VYAENFHAGLGTMEVLSLQGCNVGINSVSYLSELWMQTPAEKNALVSLNLGMNDLDLLAWRRLIEPINARKLGSLRELSIPLNLIEPEGIIILSNACTLGSLDSLVHLDISDVGGNSECILVLARALVLRWQNKQLCLRRLKILGRAPFAGRNARVIFGKEFMDEVSVS
jgi:Ran GTPase-activating protein (RanGAP) involved in mRNA processing and transport